jgi:glycerol-3-phosphate acyltransferase PlsY
VAAWALAALVWYRHRDNLQRLMQGKENGFSKTKKTGRGKRRK